MHQLFSWADSTNLYGSIASTRVQIVGPEDLLSSFFLLIGCVLVVGACVAIAILIIRRRRR